MARLSLRFISAPNSNCKFSSSFQNKQNILSASSFLATRKYFAKNKCEKEMENHCQRNM